MFMQLRMAKHKKTTRKSLREKMRNLKSLSKTELIEIIKAQQHDFAALNQIHNNRACRQNWCQEYERNQRRYNKCFRIFQLQGRTFEEEVEQPYNLVDDRRLTRPEIPPHRSLCVLRSGL